jgi:hypothetical protein
MTGMLKRTRWLVAATLTAVLFTHAALADDDNSGGGSTPDYTPYWQAYQAWVQWQHRI